MLSEGWAKRFAEKWIAAWNSHGLEQILFHYAEDFEMTTPVIVKLLNEPSGTIRGKRTVGAYWAKALAQVPDFQFELLEVLIGVAASPSITGVHSGNSRQRSFSSTNARK